jgi:hypothetical protein
MRRKRRKVVVTVTETWTFVFDAAGETPLSAPSLEQPPLAPILTPPPDDLPPGADAPASSNESGHDG